MLHCIGRNEGSGGQKEERNATDDDEEPSNTGDRVYTEAPTS